MSVLKHKFINTSILWHIRPSGIQNAVCHIITLSDHCPVWQSLRQAVWRVSSFTNKCQIFFHSHLVDQQDHFPRKHCLPAVTTGPELQQWLQWWGWFDLCQGQCWCHGCMPNLVQQECDKCEPTWDSASSESESHCLSLFSSDAL